MQAMVIVLVDALMKYTGVGGPKHLYELAQPSHYSPNTCMPPADVLAVQPCLIDSILYTRQPRHLEYFFKNAMVVCVNTLAILTLVHLMPTAEPRLEAPLPWVVPYYAMIGEPTLTLGCMFLFLL